MYVYVQKMMWAYAFEKRQGIEYVGYEDIGEDKISFRQSR